MLSHLVLASSVLGSLVMAQEWRCYFNECKQSADAFRADTCGPLQARNARHYSECLCIQALNVNNCFINCLNITEQQERERPAAARAVDMLCASAGMDPKNISAVEWATATPPPRSSTSLPSTTSSLPRASSSSPPPQSSNPAIGQQQHAV
jgi:hypothetical protein